MKSRLIRYASLGGALLLWIVFGFVNAEFKFINPVMFPSPKDVALAGWELRELLPKDIGVSLLRAGEGFGESTLLEGGVRNASVRCSSAVEVLRLARADFLSF